ncbi:YaaC family protein [Spongorhabdus nitratireducens]
MLGSLLADKVDVSSSQNNPPFETDYDYQEILDNHQSAIEDWKALNKQEKLNYKNNLVCYMKEYNVLDPKDEAFLKCKNFHILTREIDERIKSVNSFEMLPIDDLHFEKSLLELMENIENTVQIRELYKLRNKTLGKTKNAGVKADDAARLKNCLRQGRELFLSGKNGSLMVKPLNYFYSLTAYSYAAIILNNPIRYNLEGLPGSHGVNFLPDDMRIQFGGEMPHGTFSDLFTSFPTTLIRNKNFEVIQDNTDSILAFYKNKHTVSMGTMLSMIPEIREYHKLITGERSRTHPLEITLGNDRRINTWEFQIGDGETKIPSEEIENAFPNFSVVERHGKFVVSVPAVDSHKIKASITVDARGNFWFIENPFFPVILPEMSIHFILTNVFSNIMRYSPDRWGGILLNEVNSDISLIVRKYLSAFENKFPILLLRSISKYYPYIIEN